MMLTTHYMSEAESLCDRMLIMDHDDIVTEGKKSPLNGKTRVKCI